MFKPCSSSIFSFISIFLLFVAAEQQVALIPIDVRQFAETYVRTCPLSSKNNTERRQEDKQRMNTFKVLIYYVLYLSLSLKDSKYKIIKKSLYNVRVPLI